MIRILIAAGGTGGHIMPAIHIAERIREIQPFAVIEFIGAGRSLEGALIDSRGYKRHIISTVGVKRRGIIGWIEFLTLAPKTAVQVVRLISNFKPDIVLGVGGYVTFFPVILAKIMRVRRWIHEAELKPGLANLVLSVVADRVSVTSEKAYMPFWAKTVLTGHPVRAGLELVQKEFEDFSSNPKNILILGGSQGANAIDHAFLEILPALTSHSISIWHQCRAENIAKLEAEYKRVGIDAKVMTFIHNMAEAYSWSHIVISRSGRGGVAELSVVNRPSILIPYPFAQGNHQYFNAELLEKTGKAIIVQEGEDFHSRLIASIKSLLEHKRFHDMKNRARDLSSIGAAERIAQGIVDLCNNR